MSLYISPDKAVAFKSIRGAVIHVYKGRALAEHAPHSDRIGRDSIIGPRCYNVGVIIAASSKDAPDEGFRKATAESLKSSPIEVVASCFVIPLSGFLGAVARTVVAGIQMTAGARHPQKVTSNLDEGAAWLIDTRPLEGVTKEILIAEATALQQMLTS